MYSVIVQSNHGLGKTGPIVGSQRKAKTMDYETAIESRVSVKRAILEIKAHGFVADHDNGELFDCASGETIAAIRDGEVSGGDVLAWLGY